jgi:hypothetical protein
MAANMSLQRSYIQIYPTKGVTGENFGTHKNAQQLTGPWLVSLIYIHYSELEGVNMSSVSPWMRRGESVWGLDTRFLGQKREKKITAGAKVIGSWTSVFGLGK